MKSTQSPTKKINTWTRIENSLDRRFSLKEKDSTLKIEIMAGLSTYLSLSYIFIVNPSILGGAGMDKTFVFLATIFASAFATLWMGFRAKLPFVLSTGLEMNAYVAFVVVAGMGMKWQEGLGIVFYSGLIFIVLNNFFGLRAKIITAIPEAMKLSLALSVAVFLFMIAMNLSGVLSFNGLKVNGIGEVFSLKAAALYIGIVLIFILSRIRFKGAILAGILIVAAFCNLTGVGQGGAVVESIGGTISYNDWFRSFGSLAFGVILKPEAWVAIIILFLIDYYGSIAKFIGLTQNTNIDYKDKSVLRRALNIDGWATLGGAFIGTTSVTTFVESAIGIGEGGRTGITAITCGILILLTVILLPVIKFIPVEATTGALVYVAYLIFPKGEQSKQIFKDKKHMIIGIIMGLLVFFFSSLESAMLAGFLAYFLMELHYDKKINWVLLLSAIALAVGIVLQLVI